MQRHQFCIRLKIFNQVNVVMVRRAEFVFLKLALGDFFDNPVTDFRVSRFRRHAINNPHRAV